MSARAALKEIEARRSAALRNHENGVGRIAAAIATAMGQEPSACEAISIAASFHDIGKLSVSEMVLNKPGKLDADEWEAVKRHTQHGFEILKAAGNGLADLAATVALCHHECWDGSGYPNKLKADQIPFEAQLVSVSDYYDALREIRAYKAPRTHEEVMHMILYGDGRASQKFDPSILSFIAADDDILKRAYGEPPHS